MDREGFFSRTKLDPSTGCLLWTGAKSTSPPCDYGRLLFLGKRHYAHRVAFFFKYGRWAIPNTLHACNNPPCVNWQHLYEGTASDNEYDKVKAGTHRYAGRGFCVNGHEFDAENTHHRKESGGKSFRFCRACQRDWKRKNRKSRTKS